MDSRTLLTGVLAAALLAAAVIITLPPAPAPAPAGPASPAPSLRPDAPGTLTITSRPPGAAIWMDADPGPSAMTPATLTLSPITHPVLLRYPGYRDYATSVVVRPGANSSLAIEMKPGS